MLVIQHYLRLFLVNFVFLPDHPNYNTLIVLLGLQYETGEKKPPPMTINIISIVNNYLQCLQYLQYLLNTIYII